MNHNSTVLFSSLVLLMLLYFLITGTIMLIFPVLYIVVVSDFWSVDLKKVKEKTNKLVSVPYSCMDTSSKTWLPHQSQFGLVGQAEVCCGGPGVLTPSESVFSPTLVEVYSSLLSTVPNSYRLFSSLSWSNKIFLCYICFYMFPCFL